MDLRESGDRVALLWRFRAEGASTGLPVDYRFAPMMTFRDGKVVRMDRYAEWAEALAAIDLA